MELDEWTPASDECSACGITLGEGRGQCRPAQGTTLCLDCATLYDPPTRLICQLCGLEWETCTCLTP